jgi:site-specific recombinase XerD
MRPVRAFLDRYPTPLDELNEEHVRAFLLDITRNRKLSATTNNQALAGLQHLFFGVLERPIKTKGMRRRKDRRALPVVLSREEVALLINTPMNLKHRTLIMTLYSTGVRVNELINLKVPDIRSARMQVLVRQGKGNKDRLVMLSKRLLETLRTYWKVYRPKTWLFPSRNPAQHLNASTVQRVVKQAGLDAGLTQRVTPHVLRHCFATHLLENGTNLKYIQELLGHRSIHSTMVYLHVCGKSLTDIPSPLDQLPE